MLVLSDESRVEPDQGDLVVDSSGVLLIQDDWELPVLADQTKVRWGAVRIRPGIGSSNALQLVVVFQAVVLSISNHWCVWTNHRHCDVAFVVDVRHGNGTFQMP